MLNFPWTKFFKNRILYFNVKAARVNLEDVQYHFKERQLRLKKSAHFDLKSVQFHVKIAQTFTTV